VRWQSAINYGFIDDSSPQPKTQQHPLGAHRPLSGLRRAPGIEGWFRNPVHNCSLCYTVGLGGRPLAHVKAETTPTNTTYCVLGHWANPQRHGSNRHDEIGRLAVKIPQALRQSCDEM
jgi:hypothetical protein